MLVPDPHFSQCYAIFKVDFTFKIVVDDFRNLTCFVGLEAPDSFPLVVLDTLNKNSYGFITTLCCGLNWPK